MTNDTYCEFCDPELRKREQTLENDLCMFIQRDQPVLTGSGLIIPKAHRETVFDLTADEWAASFELLQQVKKLLDEQHNPDGYNVGWNNGEAAGQHVKHVHMHVMPRFADEPRAGMGIRYWIKQEENRRPSKH